MAGKARRGSNSRSAIATRSNAASTGTGRRNGANVAGQGTSLTAVPHYLVATDADWILDQVQAALGGPDTRWTVCRSGKAVREAVAGASTPVDAALLDLQIGTMGGMAVTLDLRLEESGGRLPHVPVVMLLDQQKYRCAACAVAVVGALFVVVLATPQKPGGSSVYLSDKELLDAQSATDDGEVEE